MGILGFTNAHSIISLIAGTAIGLLLVGALALTKTNRRVGRISAAVITLLPLGQFLPKFLKDHKVYPAGIMVAAGLITFGVLLGGHFMAMSQKTAEPS